MLARVRILVVEDEAPVRSFLERGLREQGYVVESTGNGDDALERARAGRYDVVILDVMLPGRDGLEVVRALREVGDATPVILLTARDAVEDLVAGLDAGASDYIAKPFAFAELLARLRALLRRGSPAARVLEVGGLRIDLATRAVEREGVKIDLTAREYALLEYLARHAGHVVTRTMIAEHVWDTRYDTYSNVIDVYIRYLRRKIDDPFDTPLIHTRRGVGYLLGAEG
jgi:DNA-binding response OmpR family regulator